MKSYMMPFALLSTLLLFSVGCSDQPLDTEFDAEIQEVRSRSIVLSADEASSGSVDKEGGFLTSKKSAQYGPYPDINISSSNVPGSETGTLDITIVGADSKTRYDIPIPDRVSWTSKDITIDYNGSTISRPLNANERKQLAFLRNKSKELAKIKKTPAAGRNLTEELSKPGTSPDDMVRFFEAEGFQATIVDGNHIRVTRSRQMGASRMESRHIFDINAKEFVKTVMLKDGVEVFSNIKGGSATMRVNRPGGTINLTLAKSN